MENTGLTMGRDKDFPFRVLVVGCGIWTSIRSAGFSLPSCPSLATREFWQAGEQLSGPSDTAAWGTWALFWCIGARIRGGRAAGTLRGLFLPHKGRKRPKCDSSKPIKEVKANFQPFSPKLASFCSGGLEPLGLLPAGTPEFLLQTGPDFQPPCSSFHFTSSFYLIWLLQSPETNWLILFPFVVPRVPCSIFPASVRS